MKDNESSKFTYSEATRTQMLEKMQTIASKEEISAKELEDVAWLILGIDTIKGKEIDDKKGFVGEVALPNLENTTLVLENAKRSEYFDILLADGTKDIRGRSGEYVCMREERGSLRWRVGMYDTGFSKFLGREIKYETGIDLIMAVEALSPKEHSVLAKRLVAVYQESLSQPS